MIGPSPIPEKWGFEDLILEDLTVESKERFLGLIEQRDFAAVNQFLDEHPNFVTEALDHLLQLDGFVFNTLACTLTDLLASRDSDNTQQMVQILFSNFEKYYAEKILSDASRNALMRTVMYGTGSDEESLKQATELDKWIHNLPEMKQMIAENPSLVVEQTVDRILAIVNSWRINSRCYCLWNPEEDNRGCSVTISTSIWSLSYEVTESGKLHSDFGDVLEDSTNYEELYKFLS